MSKCSSTSRSGRIYVTLPSTFFFILFVSFEISPRSAEKKSSCITLFRHDRVQKMSTTIFVPGYVHLSCTSRMETKRSKRTSWDRNGDERTDIFRTHDSSLEDFSETTPVAIVSTRRFLAKEASGTVCASSEDLYVHLTETIISASIVLAF